MYAATLRFATFRPTPYSLLPVSRSWPPFKGQRVTRALRRSLPTRRATRSFSRFYDRLLARREKILFTQTLAGMRHG